MKSYRLYINWKNGMKNVINKGSLHNVLAMLESLDEIPHFIIIEHDIEKNIDMPFMYGYNTEQYYQQKELMLNKQKNEYCKK